MFPFSLSDLICFSPRAALLRLSGVNRRSHEAHPNHHSPHKIEPCLALLRHCRVRCRWRRVHPYSVVPSISTVAGRLPYQPSRHVHMQHATIIVHRVNSIVCSIAVKATRVSFILRHFLPPHPHRRPYHHPLQPLHCHHRRHRHRHRDK